ncbi:hypothetical protein ACSLPA_34415, partial [Escherichia coli]
SSLPCYFQHSVIEQLSGQPLLTTPGDFCGERYLYSVICVDRWRELEGATAKIPQTFSEALRLAADLEDQKAELEKQLALA